MQLSVHSLRGHTSRKPLERILRAALDAGQPAVCLPRHLQLHNEILIAGGTQYDLRAFGRIFLLAVGKAAEPMADAALRILGDRLVADGLIVTKHASRGGLRGLPILEADHPVPSARSLAAGREVVRLVSDLRADDLLICLFSGGASALMVAPPPPPPLRGTSPKSDMNISVVNQLASIGFGGGWEGVAWLQQLQSITSTLLARSASIDELNAVRRRLDSLKGGGLAQLAAPARVISFILSDVVGDKLEVIASGPTAPDPTPPEFVERVIAKYQLNFPPLSSRRDQKNPGVLRVLGGKKNRLQTFDHVQNILIGSNTQSARAALTQARREGFRARILTTQLQGEARLVGADLARRLRRARTRPLCLIAGGETTVTVRGNGKGGRNQELALAAALELDGMKGALLISLATDGEDGVTDAAGAVVTGETISRARALGLDAPQFLARNDSHTFFSALGDLVVTGSTGTNVNDLVLMFGF